MTVIKKPMCEAEYQESKKCLLHDAELGAFITVLVAAGAIYTESIVAMCIALFFAVFEFAAMFDYFDICKSHDEMVKEDA